MLEQLYQRYHRELLLWCRSMTKDWSASEDLVQEAFLQALSNLPLLENLTDAQRRAWLYRTAKHRYLDRLRHARFETSAESLPQVLHPSPEYDRIDWEHCWRACPGKKASCLPSAIWTATLPPNWESSSACRRERSVPNCPWQGNISKTP